MYTMRGAGAVCPQRCTCVCTHALGCEGDETRKCVGVKWFRFQPIVNGNPWVLLSQEMTQFDSSSRKVLLGPVCRMIEQGRDRRQ